MAKKDQPETGACGHPVNSSGNCSSSGCWNHLSKRHEDGRSTPGDPIAPMPNPDDARAWGSS